MFKFKKHFYFLSVLNLICSLSLFFWIEYFSPDARYVKDNLHYISCNFPNNNELTQSTPIIEAITPLPINLSHINSKVEIWTYSYLSIASNSNIDNLNEKDFSANPYNTFSRLILTGNMEDVQAVYNNIIYCMSYCSPQFPITDASLSEWASNTKTYNTASKACAEQVYLFIFLLIWNMCSFLMLFFLAKLSPKRENGKTKETKEKSKISQN